MKFLFKVVSHKPIKAISKLPFTNGCLEVVSEDKNLEGLYQIPTGYIIDGTRLAAAIKCDFKLVQHPRIQRMGEWIAEKVLSIHSLEKNEPKFLTKDKFDQFVNSILQKQFVQLALNTIPESKDQLLDEKMVVWIFTLFSYDNVIDDPESVIAKDEIGLKNLVGKFVEFLNGGISAKDLDSFLDKEQISQKDKDNIAILRGWIDLFKNYSYSQQFFKEAENYFKSSIDEMEHMQMTDLYEYIDTRRISGAVASVIELAKETPKWLLVDRHFSDRFEKAIIDYIWGVNDITSAKEYNGHEPNYLKVRVRELLKLSPGKSEPELFKMAFSELVTHINRQHDRYVEYKEKIFAGIESGSILAAYDPKFYALTDSEKKKEIAFAKQEFKELCLVRERLAIAGNECARLSTRYFDPKNNKLNVEINSNFHSPVL
jgi:hypothetical protein